MLVKNVCLSRFFYKQFTRQNIANIQCHSMEKGRLNYIICFKNKANHNFSTKNETK